LDSKDAGPVRPSLFDAADLHRPAEAKAPLRATGTDSTASGPGFGARGAGVALGAILLGGWIVHWWIGNEGGNSAAVAPVPAGAVQARGEVTGAAVLVDGGGTFGTPAGTIEDPLSVIRNRAEGLSAASGDRAVSPMAPDAGPQAVSSSPVGAPVLPGAPASGSGAARSGAAAPRAPRQAPGADLLATLLANIRERPASLPTASAPPQTLDELVAQLVRQDDIALSAVAVDPGPEQRSARLQTQLRNCPAANTLEGIRCRQRLCARHPGDPACPGK